MQIFVSHSQAPYIAFFGSINTFIFGPNFWRDDTSKTEDVVWFPSNLIQEGPFHFFCPGWRRKENFSTWRQHKCRWRTKATLFSILLSFHTDLQNSEVHNLVDVAHEETAPRPVLGYKRLRDLLTDLRNRQLHCSLCQGIKISKLSLARKPEAEWLQQR